jgi:hypothetical protein
MSGKERDSPMSSLQTQKLDVDIEMMISYATGARHMETHVQLLLTTANRLVTQPYLHSYKLRPAVNRMHEC